MCCLPAVAPSTRCGLAYLGSRVKVLGCLAPRMKNNALCNRMCVRAWSECGCIFAYVVVTVFLTCGNTFQPCCWITVVTVLVCKMGFGTLLHIHRGS